MKKYSIELSEDEVVILSEWLSRFNKRDDEKFRDQAEQRALWNLDCQLEKLNEIVFAPDYDERLNKAYARVRDQ